MEKSLRQFDREYMKTAILKQEKTFREQVNELHRLYGVQKMLMRDMRRSALKRPETYEHQINGGMAERWHGENRISGHGAQETPRPLALDLERPAEEYIEQESENTALRVEDEDEIELTLATGTRRKKKEENSSGASFSSSSTESGGENPKLQDWLGLFQFAGMNRSFPEEEEKKKMEKSGEFNVEMVGQDSLKHPPWLFHCLSLNMT